MRRSVIAAFAGRTNYRTVERCRIFSASGDVAGDPPSRFIFVRLLVGDGQGQTVFTLRFGSEGVEQIGRIRYCDTIEAPLIPRLVAVEHIRTQVDRATFGNIFNDSFVVEFVHRGGVNDPNGNFVHDVDAERLGRIAVFVLRTERQGVGSQLLFAELVIFLETDLLVVQHPNECRIFGVLNIGTQQIFFTGNDIQSGRRDDERNDRRGERRHLDFQLFGRGAVVCGYVQPDEIALLVHLVERVNELRIGRYDLAVEFPCVDGAFGILVGRCNRELLADFDLVDRSFAVERDFRCLRIELHDVVIAVAGGKHSSESRQT